MVIIEGKDEEDAIQNLYKTYEHIQGLHMKEHGGDE